jgi:hypothetical protein
MAQSLVNQQYSIYLQRVNLIYQRPEVKASLEIILSVFTVTMLIFFAIRPTITNIFSLQKKITDQEVLLKKTDNKIAQLINAQKQISDNSEIISLLSVGVPDKFDYFNYAKRVEILASKNNVNLDSLSLPGQSIAGTPSLLNVPADKAKNYITPDKDGLSKVLTNFVVYGDQNGVFGFLSDLENMDRVALIDSLDISKTLKTALDTKGSLKVTGQVYFYTFNNKK